MQLRAIGEIPTLVREMLGDQLDPKTNIVSLDEHGFLSSFVADIRNRLSRRQEIDRDSTFFQERNSDGQVFASKVWFLEEADQRLYCIQPSDESDDYKRELLQRIRSAALEASRTASAATVIEGEVDSAFVGELTEAMGNAIGMIDHQHDEVILNTRARELLGLPSSMPTRIQTGRLRSYLADTFFPCDRFAEFWTSLIAAEQDTVRLRRGRPFEMELQFQSIPLSASALGLWKIEEVVTCAAEPVVPSPTENEDTRQMSRLTGGIAHEFNNLLTPIIGNLSLTGDQLDRGGVPSAEFLRQSVDDSLAAGLRATRLVADLMLCSDNTILKPSSVDANEIGLELAEEFHAMEGTDCALQLDLDDELWPITGDRDLIKSIVTELADNAIEAGAAQGDIRITTRNCNLADPVDARRKVLEPGGYIVISVGDHGPGVPKELASRIFEPFFSSKPQGQGVGLGLASSLGIARRHGGTLTCSSSDGEGSIFSLFLPRAEKLIEPIQVTDSPCVEAAINDTAGRTVLIVDDEPLVRRLAQATLENCGYKTLQAEDGIDALAVIDSNPDSIDLILLDLTMPRMSGQEMLRELERQGSSIPVIVCTGYLAQTEDLVGVYSGGPSRFVLKPFHPSSLLDEVHQELLS